MNHFFEDEYEEKILKSPIPVLMDFYADWCGPCRALGPKLEKTSETYQDKIKLIKINCDECPNLVEQFSIQSIPTLIIMKDGKEMDRHVGSIPENQLTELIEKYI